MLFAVSLHKISSAEKKRFFSVAPLFSGLRNDTPSLSPDAIHPFEFQRCFNN
jgi:hypothetical protein